MGTLSSYSTTGLYSETMLIQVCDTKLYLVEIISAILFYVKACETRGHLGPV